jgi:hypothetical protein
VVLFSQFSLAPALAPASIQASSASFSAALRSFFGGIGRFVSWMRVPISS